MELVRSSLLPLQTMILLEIQVKMLGIIVHAEAVPLLLIEGDDLRENLQRLRLFMHEHDFQIVCRRFLMFSTICSG